MADNFFGIEDEFSESNRVNDVLFADTDPNELEDVKKAKEKADAEAAAKKLADEKAAAIKAKATTKPVAATKEETVEEVEDPTESLFGDPKKKEEKAEGAEETTEEEETEETTEEGDDDKSQFEILSKSLYQAGVFTADVDPETGEEVVHTAKTPEEFKKLFEYQKQRDMYAMLDNHLSKFGEDRQELFDAIFNKGVDPKEYLPVYNRIEDFESLTTDTEANQERIVSEWYRRSGVPEDKIAGRVQKLKDISELQAEAEDTLPLIINQDKKALKDQEDNKAAEIEADKQKDVQYKNSLVKILTEKIQSKEFDGIPVSEQTAQKAFDFLYNKKWQGKDGKKFTDFDKFVLELNKPENHALKIKAGLLFQNNLDLTKVQKKAVSKESSELFSEFATKKTKQATKQKAAPAPWNL
jgi:hypothetical protein